MKIVYESSCGKQFNTKEECEKYEKLPVVIMIIGTKSESGLVNYSPENFKIFLSEDDFISYITNHKIFTFNNIQVAKTRIKNES